MALVRSTPLLATIAQVVDLTGQQGIVKLETAGEFTAADTLLAAHKWVHDYLKNHRRLGAATLAALTNQEELERAEAYYFLSLLAAAGYLGGDRQELSEHWEGKAILEADKFDPELPSSTYDSVTIPSVTKPHRRRLFSTSLDTNPNS